MQQASTQRISIIGLDYEQLTSQELETVHNKVCAPDVSAASASSKNCSAATPKNLYIWDLRGLVGAHVYISYLYVESLRKTATAS